MLASRPRGLTSQPSATRHGYLCRIGWAVFSIVLRADTPSGPTLVGLDRRDDGVSVVDTVDRICTYD